LAVLVTGGGLADGAAAPAGLGAGLGGAVATQPVPADRPVQMDDPHAEVTTVTRLIEQVHWGLNRCPEPSRDLARITLLENA
jgi:hypothetical protein